MTTNSRLALWVAVASVCALLSPSSPLAQQPSDKAQKSEPKASKSADKKETKPAIARQQKMKDCGAKWNDEKKEKGLSGKAAYQKFLSGCLKG